jgi:lysophospholipase L1-like esterase
LPSASPSAGDGAEWTYVAFGDSIVGEGYPQALADLIEHETGRSVAVSSFADGAATSASLLASLRTPGPFRDAVAGADIVTITVGGNDADPFATYPADMCAPGGNGSTCLVRYNSDLEVNYDAILTEIETLRAGRPTLIRPTSPDYNPFIGWDAAPTPDFGLTFYRQVAEAETQLICSLATTHGMVCADFYHAFNGVDGTEDAASLLAADHGHPSAAGSELIAQIIFEGGLAPLQ